MMKKKRIAAALTAVILSVFFAGCAQGGTESGSSEPQADKTAASEAEDTKQSEAEAESEAGSEPEERSEMFDTEPIIKAFHSGDSSGLSELELQILDKASQIYSEVVTDDMSEYEKELALHDYLIANCSYDSGALRAIPKPSENSDNPYGALVNGQAICKGYTTTFYLFMGMAEIPCIIIHSADTDGEEHAWNAVQLDGDWYYVDATWDDPVPDVDGRLIEHTYFNVSKKFMLEKHVLSDSDPETASTKYSYSAQQAIEITSLDELSGVFDAAFERHADSADVIFGSQELESMLNKKGNYAFVSDENGEELDRMLDRIKADKKIMIYRIPFAETELGTVYSFTFIELER